MSDFQVFVPVEFFTKSGQRRFRGFVTTEHRDREGETALMDGMDFSEFMQHGWFNDNHSKKTGDVLGWPTKLAKRKTPDGKRGVYVEGRLINGHPPADAVWTLAQALAKDDSGRKLGFSVEGAILERGGYDNKQIKKAIVRNVAITANPVNPYTGMDILVKALTAGGSVNPPATQPGEGFALRPESLEGRPKKKRKRDMVAKRLGVNPESPVVDRVLRLATRL